MAQDEFRDVNLTVKIDNFKRRRCPYCGIAPTEMEWSHEGMRVWCRNPECTGGHYRIFTAIDTEKCNDIVEATWSVLSDWGKYCSGIRQQKEMAKRVSGNG